MIFDCSDATAPRKPDDCDGAEYVQRCDGENHDRLVKKLHECFAATKHSAPSACSVKGCEEKPRPSGLCEKHKGSRCAVCLGDVGAIGDVCAECRAAVAKEQAQPVFRFVGGVGEDGIRRMGDGYHFRLFKPGQDVDSGVWVTMAGDFQAPNIVPGARYEITVRRVP